MNENIKDVLKVINEHPDLPVIPMVGQDIVADSFGEWTAEVGEAEIRKICIYEDAVIFYDENTLKTAGMLELDYEALGIPDSMSSGEANRRLKTFIDSLDWLEAIIVHIETPIVNIPDNTEKIYEVQEG
jgi:hypothetical protein